jgi:hypothetical protein
MKISHLIRDAFWSGGWTSATTAAAIAAAGKIEDDNALAPLNAISHMAWGEEAAQHEEFSFKYTMIGMALNKWAQIGWAGMFEVLRRPLSRKNRVAGALGAATITAATAYVVDYHLVPKRLTPGFEDRLSCRSMVAIYGVMALTLAVSALLNPWENENAAEDETSS